MCPAVDPVQLSEQDILTALLQGFGQLFDEAAGQRLLKQLLDRGDSAPIQLQTTARQLGSQFPLFGYRSVVRALSSELVNMEVNKPKHKITANPRIGPVPMANRIIPTMNVVTLASTIVANAQHNM